MIGERYWHQEGDISTALFLLSLELLLFFFLSFTSSPKKAASRKHDSWYGIINISVLRCPSSRRKSEGTHKLLIQTFLSLWGKMPWGKRKNAFLFSCLSAALNIGATHLSSALQNNVESVHILCKQNSASFALLFLSANDSRYGGLREHPTGSLFRCLMFSWVYFSVVW